jgi:hypothetical protein
MRAQFFAMWVVSSLLRVILGPVTPTSLRPVTFRFAAFPASRERIGTTQSEAELLILPCMIVARGAEGHL